MLATKVTRVMWLCHIKELVGGQSFRGQGRAVVFFYVQHDHGFSDLTINTINVDPTYINAG